MWQSKILRDWQKDYNTLDSFVEKSLPQYETLVQSRLKPGQKQIALQQFDGLIGILEKWDEYETLQRKLAKAAQPITEMRTRFESAPEKRSKIPALLCAAAVGTIYFLYCTPYGEEILQLFYK